MREALFVELIVSIILYLGIENMDLSMGMNLCYMLVVIALLTFFLRKEKFTELKKQFFRASYLFIFAFIIVQFQSNVDYSLGLDTYIFDRTNPSMLNILKGACISTIGLISLLLGYCFKDDKLYKYNNQQTRYYISGNTINILYIFQVLFFILFVRYDASLYLSGRYTQEMITNMSGSMQAYSIILLECTTIAIIICQCIKLSKDGTLTTFKKYISSFSIVFYLLLVTYLIFVLISGDRGPLMTMVLAFVAGFLYTSHRKYSIITVFGVIVVGALFISILSIVRSERNREGSNSLNYKEYSENVMTMKSISPVTAELGWSYNCTILAIQNVPDRFPYGHGYMQAGRIIAVVPFSTSVIYSILPGYARMPYHSSSDFFDWITQGKYVTVGMGSSVLSDLYLDFGVIGVLLGLFLLGFILRWIDVVGYCNQLSKVPLFYICACVCMFYLSISHARNPYILELKPTLWIFVIIFVAYLLGGNKKNTLS